MSFTTMIDFLNRLQKNNSKAWMDLHRAEYHSVRDFYVAWLDAMNLNLAKLDPAYFDTPGKKAINRINNNLLYHPNRPVYKDHFGAGLDQKSKQGDFYIEIGVENCFIGGGYWHPSSNILKSIRDAIDYNGQQFKQILQKPSFKATFGEMIEGERLKLPPKGFDDTHPHIELLKRKTFAVGCYLQHSEVFKPTFEDKVIQLYLEMLPFRRYLNKAVTV